MIKYKRIYPLRSGGRLAAIVTIIGGSSSCEIFVKFKLRPKETNLMLILFNPKTYEYEMMPLEERMSLERSVTQFTACIIASRQGMFLEFLMEGSVNKSRLNTSKLKSMIAMDMYADTSLQTDCGCGSNEAEAKAEQTAAPDEGPAKEANSELMDYLKQMEEGTLPLTYTPKDVGDKVTLACVEPANREEGDVCQEEKAMDTQPKNSHVADEVIKSVHTPTKMSLSKEIEEVSGKYCEFVNPFSGRWEGIWWKVQYPDKSWHYIVGRVVVDGANVSVLGVPGERGQKPVCLESCDMYAIADNGVGYWLMFQK